MLVGELELLGVVTALLSVELLPVPARTVVLLRAGVVTVGVVARVGVLTVAPDVLRVWVCLTVGTMVLLPLAVLPELVTVLVRVSTPEMRVLTADGLIAFASELLLTVLLTAVVLVFVEVVPVVLSLDTTVDLPTTGL